MYLSHKSAICDFFYLHVHVILLSFIFNKDMKHCKNELTMLTLEHTEDLISGSFTEVIQTVTQNVVAWM